MSEREWKAALGASLLRLLSLVYRARRGGFRDIASCSYSVASGQYIEMPTLLLERLYKEGWKVGRKRGV